MTWTVRHLADLIGGTLVGDGDTVVHSARSLNEANAGDITFAESAASLVILEKSNATAAVVPVGVTVPGKTLIQVADPLMAFVIVVQHLQGKTAAAWNGVDARAMIHPSASIGAQPSIAANVVIGEKSTVGDRCWIHPSVVIGKNCKIGNDVVLHPGVVLYDDTVLGDRVIIHANSVIGADGFGYRFQKGRHVKVPQLGNVVIGDDVEIGACCTIDRSTFGSTLIGEGCKFDNLVHIAHNCKIGKHNVYAGQVGIAGSCTIGDYVIMGGQAGIKDHVTIGDGAVLGAKAGLIEDMPAGQRWHGTPACEERDAYRMVTSLKRLPGIRKDLQKVLKTLGLTDEATESARKAS